ncbi:MAG: DegT/DnrJ/EryC1/StrS family aminotransferase [Nitrospirae bacterium]|nr:DegT/DnrJ/EryC1/StrS family aminotransferase [Nitrospirota bacterium]
MQKQLLAVNGGSKTRQTPMPCRKLFGPDELSIVEQVFKDSWQIGVDFGYQGKYEKLYTDAFCEFQGGGYADAVCSGTAAIHLALQALDIEAGSDVIVSPVTDPGSVAPIIIQGHRPVPADSEPDSFNMGVAEFERAITTETRAAIITHSGGYPADIEHIVRIARQKGIKVIEDCSQAHGALFNGKKVGTFGDFAAFSTMFSKTHATGGCGGVVYTQNEEYYWKIRSLADRGKPFDKKDYDPKDPSQFSFPALNYNLDELSCAIGFSTLRRLQETIDRRCEIAEKIDKSLGYSRVVYVPESRSKIKLAQKPSPFFHTLCVNTDKVRVSKKDFANAVAAEGIPLNPDYRYIVSEWSWMRPYADMNSTPNARRFCDISFNLTFNERYSEQEISDIAGSIFKVEAEYAK